MKKRIITICLVMASLGVYAQIPSIGIKGGLNFASFTFFDGGTTTKSTSINTFNAGVFVDFKFGNLSLQPAINYTGQGGSYTQSVLVPGPGVQMPDIIVPNTETIKENLYYLQLPVNLVYHIPVIVGNIYFGAGPYVAQGLSGTTKYGSESQKADFGNAPGDVKPQQFGADAIVGFNLKNGLLINANYDLGLTSDVPSVDGSSSKARVFGISIGYVFL